MMLGPRAIGAGHRLVHLARTDSTMLAAAAASASGDCGPVWIVADQQSAGRGRQGRPWVSPPGNLHSTLLIPAEASPRDLPKLGFVAGIALRRAVLALLPGADVRLKWPNDLLLSGAKVAGLLLEALERGAAVSIGIGVNIALHPADTPYPATHLKAHGCGVDRDAVLGQLSDTMLDALALFDRGRGFPAVRREWLAGAAHRGRLMSVREGQGARIGRFVDLDEEGRLLLDADGTTHAIAAGDVFPLDIDSATSQG
jgi:BirA family biotin operon repressor/biotin-[acetyl-CoA-carboxylase] ligase